MGSKHYGVIFIFAGDGNFASREVIVTLINSFVSVKLRLTNNIYIIFESPKPASKQFISPLILENLN